VGHPIAPMGLLSLYQLPPASRQTANQSFHTPLILTSLNATKSWPTKSWNAYVRDDLVAIGHAYDWWRRCKDRERWKTTIQVLLNVPSPYDWKTCKNNNSKNARLEHHRTNWTTESVSTAASLKINCHAMLSHTLDSEPTECKIQCLKCPRACTC